MQQLRVKRRKIENYELNVQLKKLEGGGEEFQKNTIR